MTPEIIFREYHPGDENQIVELLQHVFDGWPHFDINCTPTDHWKWKFLETPLRLNSISLAEDAGKVIGFDSGIFQKLKVGNNILLAHQGTDSVIAAEYQGRGLYSKLNDFRYKLPQMKKLDCSYWASGNRKLMTWAKKRGMPIFPRQINQLIRIKDVDLHFKLQRSNIALFKKLGYTVLKDLNIKTKLNEVSCSDDYKIKDIKLFEDNIDHFLVSLFNHYKYIIVRDMRYLNWRYCDPRGGNYYIKQAEVDNDVLGYCVFRINKFDADYHKGDIMDLLTIPTRVDVAYGLVSSVLEHIDNLGVNYVSSWFVKGQYLTRILEDFGFVNTREHLHLYFVHLSDRFNYSEFEKAKTNELHFQPGDLDW